MNAAYCWCVIVLATADLSPLLWTWLNAWGSFICTATFSYKLIILKENMCVWIDEGLICWKPGWIQVDLATLTGDKLADQAHTLRNSQHASVGCSIISWRGYLERFKIAFTTWVLMVLRMTSTSMAAIKRPISSSVYGLVGSCCLAQTEI